MNCKIAVCDDSHTDRQYISGLAAVWAANSGHTASIEEFSSAESFIFGYSDKNDYDILLLDIEMGATDGVTLAKKLRQSNDTVQIIFISGYSDYILDGYDVGALHYLIKPVKAEKLFSVLDKAAEKLSKQGKVLSLHIGGEMLRIPIYQIKYAEVFGNYVTIHASEDFTAKMTLSELQGELDNHFFRISRSVLVNLSQISRVTKREIKLVDGTLLPLPRGAYESVNRAIINME